MKTPFATIVYLAAATAFAFNAPAAERVGATFPVVDTGQVKCYGSGRDVDLRSCPSPGDKIYGQDANYTLNAPAYKDNGDGTVSDTVTGLMWEKGFRTNVAWSAALGLAAKATTGGHADWRVPTLKELYSLINFQGATGDARDFSSVPSDAKPYIDTRFFGFEYPSGAAVGRQQLRFIDAQYITSTAYSGQTMGGNPTFFGVNFADGRIKGYPQRGRADGAGWYLRLVRGNPAYGRNDFTDNGDGTIVDRATGLVWMQADSGGEAFRASLDRTHYKDGRMDWPEALRFCEGLTFAGRDDWRLPNAKELQGLVDYTRSPQATRSAAVDPRFRATPITDEAGRPNFPGYWTSTTHLDGQVPGTDAVVVYFGEALGTMGGGGGGMGGSPPGSMGGPPQGPMGGPGPGPMGGPPMGGPGFRGGPPPGGMGGPGQGFAGGMSGPPQGPMMGGGPPGGMMGGPSGDGKLRVPDPSVIDVHGAGAQRSDPKVGDPDDYPKGGQGPQGDVRRVFNYVRCVRTAG